MNKNETHAEFTTRLMFEIVNVHGNPFHQADSSFCAHSFAKTKVLGDNCESQQASMFQYVPESLSL